MNSTNCKALIGNKADAKGEGKVKAKAGLLKETGSRIGRVLARNTIKDSDNSTKMKGGKRIKDADESTRQRKLKVPRVRRPATDQLEN